MKKKVIRKKNWIRYERRHSLTAVHIDWHFCAKTRRWIFIVLDDASRKLLALLECNKRSTLSSIKGIKLAQQFGQIKQCISDRGAEFTSNCGGKSKFKKFLDSQGIQQILCRIKHPQSNGKAEKFFDLYDQKRFFFDSKEEFVEWYNEKRPHRSLRFDELETPNMAFLRKLKAEVI